MAHLTPFLLFDGGCAAAMQFYQACLGGELTLIRLGDTPMKANFPEDQHHKTTYSHLKSGHVEFSATDWLDRTQAPRPGNTLGMFIRSDRPDELRSLFGKLSAGADPKLLVELHEMPFGLYGRLTDRFGVAWFFQGTAGT